MTHACFPRYHMMAFGSDFAPFSPGTVPSAMAFLRISLFIKLRYSTWRIMKFSNSNKYQRIFYLLLFPSQALLLQITVNEKECLFFDYRHMEALQMRVIVNHSVCWHCRWYNEQTPKPLVLKAFAVGLKTEITGPFSLEKTLRIIWVQL